MNTHESTVASTSLRAVVPRHIRRKWDSIALEQLCRIVPEQDDEIATLRREAQQADECAEFWRDQALDMQLQLCEHTGGAPGITQGCQLVVVPS